MRHWLLGGRREDIAKVYFYVERRPISIYGRLDSHIGFFFFYSLKKIFFCPIVLRVFFFSFKEKFIEGVLVY